MLRLFINIIVAGVMHSVTIYFDWPFTSSRYIAAFNTTNFWQYACMLPPPSIIVIDSSYRIIHISDPRSGLELPSLTKTIWQRRATIDCQIDDDASILID